MMSDRPEQTTGASDVNWLRDAEALDAVLSALPEGVALGLDTEFERVSTYYPKPGLVQMSTPDDAWLVEPTAAEGSRLLKPVLEDPLRVKLLYAMGEDLELLRVWLGIEMQGMLDLQIGAALAGWGYQVGYAKQVESVLGVSLDKGETRSDWLRRPLSAAQERYALDDVRYLEVLFVKVREVLESRGLFGALQDESRRMADDLLAQSEPEVYYLRLRGGWRLNPQQQGVLRALSLWRERQCRERDRPRNRVVSDKALLAIADSMPKTTGQLNGLEDVTPVVIRKFGDTLVELVREGGGETLTREQRIPTPLSRFEQDSYRALRTLMQQVAEQQQVPVELLAPRKRLEEWLRLKRQSPTVPDAIFEGWRGQLTEAYRPELRAIFEHE